MPPLPAQDIAGYVAAFCEDIFATDEDMGAILDRYHTPDCAHFADGRHLSREWYLTTVDRRRRKVRSYSLEVHDALVAGSKAAVRYTLRAKLGWFTVSSEAFTFGDLASDGRLRRSVSVTRTASPRGDGGLAPWSAAGLGAAPGG